MGLGSLNPGGACYFVDGLKAALIGLRQCAEGTPVFLLSATPKGRTAPPNKPLTSGPRLAHVLGGDEIIQTSWG